MKETLSFFAANVLTTKPKLLVAPQMYGSGKTTFFEKLCGGPDGNPHYEALCKDSAHTTLKQQVLDATYVLISLEKSEAFTTNIRQDIKNELSIILESLVSLTSEELAKSTTLGRRVEALQKKHNKPIFLHFDEIGAIELTKYDPWFKSDPTYDDCVKEHGRTSLEARLYRYYQLWDAVYPLLSLLNVFVAFSGKTGATGLMNFQLIQKFARSPGEIEYLLFGSLSDNYIKDILAKHHATRVSQSFLRDDLGLTNSPLLDFFCKTLYDFTGGIPRFVSNALEYFWDARNVLKLGEITKEENMKQVFQSQVLKAKLHNAAKVPLPFEELRNLDEKLDMPSGAKLKDVIMGVKFSSTDTLTFEREKTVNIIDFLNRFNCYTSTDNKNNNNNNSNDSDSNSNSVDTKQKQIQVVFPGFFRDHVFTQYLIPLLATQGAASLSMNGEGYE